MKRVLLTNNSSLVTLRIASLRPALSSAVNPIVIFLSVFHIWDWKNCKGGWVTISPSRIGRYGCNDSEKLSPCDSITLALVLNRSRADAFLKSKNKKCYTMFSFSRSRSVKKSAREIFIKKIELLPTWLRTAPTGCSFDTWIEWK